MMEINIGRNIKQSKKQNRKPKDVSTMEITTIIFGVQLEYTLPLFHKKIFITQVVLNAKENLNNYVSTVIKMW